MSVITVALALWAGLCLRGLVIPSPYELVKSHGGYPDNKVHGANMGPIWGRQDPGGPHVGPMNLAIIVVLLLLEEKKKE